MSLSNGRPYVAIPGPSVMPDRVLQAMHRGAPNIYSDELLTLTIGLIRDLKVVAGTAHHAAIYISNGHGVWEAALRNILSPGDKVLVPTVGMFGKGWATMAQSLGIEVELLEFPRLQPMDMSQIKARLAEDSSHEIKAVLVTHVDTSSSIKTDPRDLRAALDEVGHPALLGVDCIASLGCDRFEMDAWGVDLTALPSATNFVAIDCHRDGAYAKALLDALVARGVFVRMPFVAPQNRCIRLSCGRPADLERVAEALPDAIKSLS